MTFPSPGLSADIPLHANGLGLDPSLFALSPEGLSESARNRALSALSERVASQTNRCLGYQVHEGAMYGDLAQYLTLHLNNVGDPFLEGNFTLNSKVLEREVLNYYADQKTPTIP